MANRDRTIKFNEIVGNAPVGLNDTDRFWEQVQLQAKLILEEAKEQYAAAMDRDIVEVVDGACDVDYLQTYQDVLLQEVGIDLGCAKDSVAHVNEQKFTLSEDLALQSQAKLEANGVDCYVHKTEWRGDVYYLVKRTEDNKVLKLNGYVGPQILPTIPATTLILLSMTQGQA